MNNFTDLSSDPLVDNQPEDELNHSDKFIGILSEPVATIEKLAKFPPKKADGLIPVFLFLLILCITQVALNSNKAIHSQFVDEQIMKIQKNLDEAVAEGKITAEQRTKQLDILQDSMENYGTAQIINTFISAFLRGFPVFYLICGIYYILVRFVLKGEGDFNYVIVVFGLTFYIAMIDILITTILSFALNRIIPDTSVASIIDADHSTIAGFIFAKLNVFTIWGYVVLSIGLAKLYKGSKTANYFILVFGIWLIGGLVIFLVSRAVPFLRYFGM